MLEELGDKGGKFAQLAQSFMQIHNTHSVKTGQKGIVVVGFCNAIQGIGGVERHEIQIHHQDFGSVCSLVNMSLLDEVQVLLILLGAHPEMMHTMPGWWHGGVVAVAPGKPP